MLQRLSTPKKSPNMIDIQVGGRVRLRRTSLGMSQEKLGETLGITFQQIQKYEKGANRIGASRLSAISEALHVPVAFFFGESGLGDHASTATTRENDILEFLSTAEGVALNRAFAAIRDPKIRRKVVDLARAIARTEDDLVAA